MTREEYRKTYGVDPVFSKQSNLDTTPAPRMMTREEYQAEFFPAPKGKVEKVLDGEPAFPAELGGKETILPNMARSIGNLPGALFNLGRMAVAPVNPFDRENPLNIGQNIVDSAIALKDIYKNRGIKASTDIVTGSAETGKTGLGYLKKAGEAIYGNLEQNVLGEDSVARGVGVSLGQGVSKVAELAINDPTFIPSVIYTPGATLKGTDAISDIARPVIKAKNTVQDAAGFKTRTVFERTADEIAGIENNYVKLRNANDFSDDVGQASRVRIAESNVLNGAVDAEGTIRTKDAVEKYRKMNLDGKEDVVKNNLLREAASVNLEDVGRDLTSAVYRSGLEGSDLVAAVRGIKREIEGLRLRADADGNIPLSKIHDAKISTTRQINYQTPPETATFRKAKARAYKELIENNSTVKVIVNGKEYGIKEINKELSKYYDDVARLERLDGRKVKGGKLGKYFAQISGNLIGGAAGGAVGGPFGMAIGAVVGGESSGFIKGRMMSRTFGNTAEGVASRNPILDVAKAQGKGIDLKTPSQVVAVKKGIPKTKEIISVEKDIARNVASQKAAIKAGDFALVATLKEIYEVLVEKLQALVKRIKETPNKEGGFVRIQSNSDGSRKVQYNSTAKTNSSSISGDDTTAFRNFQDLSTKLLGKLEGRTTVSKQFISDLTNSPDLKQAEKDLFRELLNGEGDNINVSQFANKVKSQLLPLKVSNSGFEKGKGNFQTLYENVVLPDELRGPVASYKENLYQSPIATSAGEVHFGGAKNYFAHSRIEDLPVDGAYAHKTPSGLTLVDESNKNGTTRRVIEIQSDLFQKGRLEGEMNRDINFPEEGTFEEVKTFYEKTINNKNTPQNVLEATKEDLADLLKRQKEVDKLEPYRNTWHERVIREEVKKAAQDGKTKLQFPTGETAMKIEGLGESDRWYHPYDIYEGGGIRVKPEELKVGQEVLNGTAGASKWIITDVLGDGKFKAVPKDVYKNYDESGNLIPREGFISDNRPATRTAYEESFDISGKVDTNNPIYKFYEKEVGRYLKNKYKAEMVTDAQGVNWWEVKLDKNMSKLPVEAFGVAPLLLKDKEE